MSLSPTEIREALEQTYASEPLIYPLLTKPQYPTSTTRPRRPPISPTGRAPKLFNNRDYWNAMTALDRQIQENVKAAVVGSFVDEAQTFAAAPPLPTPEPVQRPAAVHVCPGHTRRIFDLETFPEVAEWAAKRVVAHNIDAIVGCGHSGLVIAGAISILTKVPVFAVRKQGDSPVAGTGPVTGIAPNGPAKRWCWIDDLIGSGGTLVRSMKYLIDDEIVESAIPALVMLYATGGTNGPSRTEIYGATWEKCFPAMPVPDVLVEYFANRNK